jgi:molybdenum cofactor biosynthesis protein MoaC
MRDISHKQISLRTAKASGMVRCTNEVLERIRTGNLPKGNLLDIAKAAGFLAAKKTADLIPHCHPVSIDGLQINFELSEKENNTGVIIYAEGNSIGRTGIEMEALTAVSIAALTIYDLLKPLETDIEITSIKLDEKTGGKSDKQKFSRRPQSAAILVCSDSTAAGKREDSSGILIQEMLREQNCEIADYKIIPDEKSMIQETIKTWIAQGVPFIFTTGGTGLGPRDHTVEAVNEIIERNAPGITEAMRSHGQMRTPLAMMSRSVAGSIGESIIITLPGSSNGAKECLEAILPAVFHARSMLKGGGH